MNEIPEFSPLSLSSVVLELYFSETSALLGTGTAFFYRRNGSVFLITNWHNFSGLNPFTKKPITAHGGKPDRIVIPLLEQIENETIFHKRSYELYKEKNLLKPNWLVHPILKQSVDVVALEIQIPHEYSCLAINDSGLGFKEFIPAVADDVFVIGYPYNIRQEGVLPIWKRASIASEPQYNYDNKPLILIDTATR